MRDVESLQRDLDASLAARAAAAGDYELPPLEAYSDDGAAAHTEPPPTASEGEPSKALAVEPASFLAGKAPPAPRDHIIEDIALHAGRVATMLGNGGEGKSTIGMQLAIAVATGRQLWGMEVSGGPVLNLWCEDEQDEVDRKTRAIAEAEGIDLSSLDRLFNLSRDGLENALCLFDRDQIMFTQFYRELDATVAAIRPRLLVIDTAADVFMGDFMSTPHVRQFIKTGLGGFCHRYGTAVLLIAHPSASGMTSGAGGGFSTAWNNSVRSRLFLRRPKSEDPDAIADRRLLEVKKSNYGPTGGAIPLIYERGRFIVDPDPIAEGAATVRQARPDTRLTLAVLAYFKARASSGQVVAFGAIFEALQAAGDIDRGNYEQVRKPLQRTLKSLVEDGVLRLCKVPKGYRLGTESLP